MKSKVKRKIRREGNNKMKIMRKEKEEAQKDDYGRMTGTKQ